MNTAKAAELLAYAMTDNADIENAFDRNISPLEDLERAMFRMMADDFALHIMGSIPADDWDSLTSDQWFKAVDAVPAGIHVLHPAVDPVDLLDNVGGFDVILPYMFERGVTVRDPAELASYILRIPAHCAFRLALFGRHGAIVKDFAQALASEVGAAPIRSLLNGL